MFSNYFHEGHPPKGHLTIYLIMYRLFSSSLFFVAPMASVISFGGSSYWKLTWMQNAYCESQGTFIVHISNNILITFLNIESKLRYCNWVKNLLCLIVMLKYPTCSLLSNQTMIFTARYLLLCCGAIFFRSCWSTFFLFLGLNLPPAPSSSKGGKLCSLIRTRVNK